MTFRYFTREEFDCQETGENEGIAADIGVKNGSERYIIVKHAMAMGFNGIGIHKSFVHVDTRISTPVLWEY